MRSSYDAPDLMPIQSAIELIMASIKPNFETTICALGDSLDRVIAQDIISPINVPAYDNSAMDGYALNYADYLVSRTLIQVGKSFAGNSFQGELKKGECIKIMTGAEIPKGANTVVMQENARANENRITFHDAKPADAIRPAGDDIKKGTVVFKAGCRISPIDIGLLASLGFASVPVYKRVKVAVFATGDELLAVGSPPQSNRIFDTNRPMLIAMISRLGGEVLDLGIVADSKEKIRAAFKQANEYADCVITSGGVSVGEADYTREILEEYGTIEFWKLAIKPGKPLAFGHLPNSIFFGLPGNPVSAAVTFDQIAAPAIAYLAGCNVAKSTLLPAIASSTFNKRPGRTDYQRAHYYVSDNGLLCVKTTGSQSSGVLSCFKQSNCYAVLESARGKVLEGETLHILPFTHLIQS
jgi:molybdopterin molybdotransferase